MSRNIHAGSFQPPVEQRKYQDGRDRCDANLKKIFAAGPQMPDDLFKRDRSDAAVHAALNKKLSRQERLRRSNAHEALTEIKKIHGAGGRRSLPEADGDEPFQSKSVAAVRKAQRRALHVGDNRMLSPDELNKAFSQRPATPSRSADEMHLTRDEFLRKRARNSSGDEWNRMTWQQRRDYFSKGLSAPSLNDVGTKPPQSANGTWNDVHADTGATNDWRDQAAPSTRPNVVGNQTTATPSMLTRDAAIDAIKFALRKPQKMWGARDDNDDDQDRTDDLDEDDSDEDEDDDSAKNPNRADAFE
jgi:hypothetical protein